MILGAVEELCHLSGLTTVNQNVPAVTKPKERQAAGTCSSRKAAQLANYRDLVIDTAITHEFGGNNLAGSSLHSQDPKL